MDKKETTEQATPMNRRTFVAGAAVVGASALAATTLAGCGGGGNSGGGGGGGSSAGDGGEGIMRCYINQPVSIDAFNVQESEGTQVAANLYDALTGFDYRTKQLFGAVAESWDINDDATVFTFHLRKGTKFHNGDTVTAKDFKYGWERLCNPNTTDDPSEISYHIDRIKGYDAMLEGKTTELEGVKVIDEDTLEVTLIEPFADFVYVVSHPALSPVPSGGAADDFLKYFRSPIGNGPFMMDGDWVDDQYIRIKRFGDYYGEKAKIAGCDFKIFSSPETAFTEFQAGELDFTQVPAGQIESVSAQYGVSSDGYTVNPGKQTLLGPESSTYYFTMNHKDPIFKDVNIRKAVSMAINRQAICDTIFSGTRVPATGIVPPGIDGYRDGAWGSAKYDVEGAKKALADAGYPNGEGFPTIKLSCNSGGGHEEIMQMVQGDLKLIGITAELETMEWANYLKALTEGNYQIGRLGWIADYPIMDNFLYSLFYTGTGDNRSHYSNKEFDQKLVKARSTTDTKERIKIYQEADDILAEECVVAPVMYYRHNRVGSDLVNDFFFAPNMIGWLNEMSLSKA